jgi:AcrR family transcriptional regulator
MIAKQGGFYHGLIRYHFSSKAAIFEALTEKSSQDLQAANKRWLRETARLGPRAGLSLYLDRFIAHYENDPEFFRTVVQNISQEDPLSIPGYHHLAELLSRSRADAEATNILPFDKDSAKRFLESFNTLIIHYLGSSSAEARLLGLEPDSPAYLKWVKDTMMFVFLPVLEKALTKSSG